MAELNARTLFLIGNVGRLAITQMGVNWMKIIGIACSSILALICIACGVGGNRVVTKEEAKNMVTMNKFNKIQTGMSLGEVNYIIGFNGEERSRNHIQGLPMTVMYEWKNDNGSNMNAVFQNDRLVSKTQIELPYESGGDSSPARSENIPIEKPQLPPTTKTESTKNNKRTFVYNIVITPTGTGSIAIADSYQILQIYLDPQTKKETKDELIKLLRVKTIDMPIEGQFESESSGCTFYRIDDGSKFGRLYVVESKYVSRK